MKNIAVPTTTTTTTTITTITTTTTTTTTVYVRFTEQSASSREEIPLKIHRLFVVQREIAFRRFRHPEEEKH